LIVAGRYAIAFGRIQASRGSSGAIHHRQHRPLKTDLNAIFILELLITVKNSFPKYSEIPCKSGFAMLQTAHYGYFEQFYHFVWKDFLTDQVNNFRLK
jgi:hypothetical protein